MQVGRFDSRSPLVRSIVIVTSSLPHGEIREVLTRPSGPSRSNKEIRFIEHLKRILFNARANQRMSCLGVYGMRHVPPVATVVVVAAFAVVVTKCAD